MPEITKTVVAIDVGQATGVVKGTMYPTLPFFKPSYRGTFSYNMPEDARAELLLNIAACNHLVVEYPLLDKRNAGAKETEKALRYWLRIVDEIRERPESGLTYSVLLPGYWKPLAKVYKVKVLDLKPGQGLKPTKHEHDAAEMARIYARFVWDKS